MDLSGLGRVIASGLTREELDVKADAFTPGRNLMFLLMGSAHAYQQGASSVSIGLLAEEFSLFPDQKRQFVAQAETTISAAMGQQIKVFTPLIEFGKADVVRLAQDIKRLEEQAKQKLSEAKGDASKHVFISFDHEDLDEVNLLRGQAKNDKVDLQFDDHSVKGPFDSANADYIKRQIREKIDRCSVTVVYLSERPLPANG